MRERCGAARLRATNFERDNGLARLLRNFAGGAEIIGRGRGGGRSESEGLPATGEV
jgi:hypothetical protein